MKIFWFFSLTRPSLLRLFQSAHLFSLITSGSHTRFEEWSKDGSRWFCKNFLFVNISGQRWFRCYLILASSWIENTGQLPAEDTSPFASLEFWIWNCWFFAFFRMVCGQNAKWFVGFLSRLFFCHLAFCLSHFFGILSRPSQYDLAFCLNHEIHFCLGLEEIKIRFWCVCCVSQLWICEWGLKLLGAQASYYLLEIWPVLICFREKSGGHILLHFRDEIDK